MQDIISGTSKTGRPTKYKEEYDQLIVDLVRNSNEILFLQDIADILDVAHSTMITWAKEHPSFHEAYTRAKGIIGNKLLRFMLQGANDRNFNARAVEFVYENATRCHKNRNAKVGIKRGDSIDQMLEAIQQAMEDEELRADEALSLTNATKTMFEMKVGLEVAKQIEELKRESGK